MDSKAKRNLQASHVLVDTGLFDSAASRAYYAVYLAGWSCMSTHREEPPVDRDGRRYWPHASFAERLFEWGALADLDRRDDFEYLRDRRVHADYFRDPLTREEAEEALGIAGTLLGELLEPDRHD